MKYILKLLVVLSCCLMASTIYAGFFTEDSDTLVKRVMTEWMAQNNVPGVAVELYVDGKPSAYYYGVAKKEDKTPITENTIFELGGVSGVMTSLMVTEEIDYAKMNFKDPLTKYDTHFPSTLDDTTLLDVAANMSGLPQHLPGTVQTQADLLSYLSTWHATTVPGDKWAPSLTNAGVLRYALEKSTTKDYDWLFFRHVTMPLGMKHLGLNIDAKYFPDVAQGYTSAGTPAEATPANLYSTIGLKVAAIDMQKFLSAAIGLPGTSDRILFPMKMSQSAYLKLAGRYEGLEWQLHPTDVGKSTLINEPLISTSGTLTIDQIYDQPLFDGDRLIDKAGSSRGFGAYIAVLPNKKSGIVVLANKQVPDDAIARVGREILLKLA